MRIFRTLLSTAVFLLVAVVAYGQLSDQQVISEVKRLQATGASQQQILTELAAKGVTREQAERIVNRNKKCSDFGKKNYSGNGNSLCSNFGNKSAVTVVLN